MPVHFDGFKKRPKHAADFGQYMILSNDIFVIDGQSIFLRDGEFLN
jgi:hypothetical protein